MNKIITIDLTKLRNHAGVLFPHEEIELKLIELYSNKVTRTHNPIKEFTNLVISKAYHHEGEYAYNEIRGFYDSNKYLNIVTRILTLIEHYICNSVEDPNFDLVTFNKYISNDKKIEVEYNVRYSNTKQQTLS